ncbi:MULTISPECIES: pyridoxamine 5'-phosphate oxidase family protein [unclassified Streptomyces]|uniref:helix-turn-helix domain-containing protein n=1 Tax=unclassified Streptomyces TaxID=2593676 RepID=UPI000700F496|nr:MULTISPECIES: pyridoxamine 5'-phosphate oxidase family protein [unclassified Streptomyces]KQX46256.1 DNA-binding protein [Streptomyces sp. Root1304]KRA81041.1 DNA-binding protein [Streptomyces sp. Root66D1]
MNTADGRHTPQATSDLGRRVAVRRAELGLSREEVAERAGSSPSYIAYVEERVPAPGIEFLVRLANALETTVQDLTGATTGLAPGGARAGYRARMEEIDEAECWELLDGHGVGRVAVEGRDGLMVIPVNYQLVDGQVVFMTAADSSLARGAASGAEVAFEEDRLDEAFSQGWSVLVVGSVRTVSDETSVRRIREAVHSEPWAGDGRDTVVTLSPRRVTGRRIRVPGAPGTPPGSADQGPTRQ